MTDSPSTNKPNIEVPNHVDKIEGILETDYNDLPRGNMKTIKIAFDVDGTLRCNCTNICDDMNKDIVDLFFILSKFKNTEIFVWSGGGDNYARNFAIKFGLPIKENHCISKFGAPKMDIAIDDIQETNLGLLNLIVRCK